MSIYRVLMVTEAPCGTVFSFAIQVKADYAWQAKYFAGNEFPDSETISVKEVI